MDNYDATFFCRSSSYVPLFAFDGFLMVSLAYWMTGLLPTVGGFLTALGIAILVEQSAAAFGVMLSSASPSYILAISIAGPILTVCCRGLSINSNQTVQLLSLTGGLYANVGELPNWIGWISYVSWFRYGFEAFSISQWYGADSEGACLGEAKEANGTITCQSAQSILDNFSFRADNFVFDIVAMIVALFLFYLIGLLGLWFRIRRAR